MKSKSIFITAALLLFGVLNSNAQTTFGITGGLNFSNVVEKGDGITVKMNSLTGIHLGGVAEIPIKDQIFFEPGLLYSMKGYKEVEAGYGDEIFRLSYIEIPLNLEGKFPVGEDDLKVFGKIGPYLGFLLSAKDKFENASQSFKDEMKSTDVGLNIGAGIELNNLKFGLQYGFGLANISNDKDATYKNKVFGISVTYLFKNN